jgi:hypothetical protein
MTATMIDLGIKIFFSPIRERNINDIDMGIKAILSRHANMCINFVNELI